MGFGVRGGPGINQKIVGSLRSGDKSFLPVDRKITPPLSSAVVVVPKKPELLRGSLRYSAANISPFSNGFTYFSLCSFVPCKIISSQIKSAPAPNSLPISSLMAVVVTMSRPLLPHVFGSRPPSDSCVRLPGEIPREILSCRHRYQ